MDYYDLPTLVVIFKLLLIFLIFIVNTLQMKYLFGLVGIGLIISCNSRQQERGLICENHTVVSGHPIASKIGFEILSSGGNAFDAAVAVEFSLCVCLPAAGNIGGGGFMVLRTKGNESITLDYRERAPELAGRDMFLDENGDVVSDLSTSSHLSCGVPGTVDGMVKLHKRYGSLAWKNLLQPAIDLAYTGFPITAKQAESLNQNRQKFIDMNNNFPAFVKDTVWVLGDTLKQPELGETLMRIRDYGRIGFYEGVNADLIISTINKGNGLITLNDLKNYSSLWRETVNSNYRGYDIISMPPPSSGGICLIQLLNILENYKLSEMVLNSAEYINLLTEAEKLVYCDRSVFLGDPDYVNIPVNGLIDKDYITDRFKTFRKGKITPSENIKAGNPWLYESEETTHYSIVDGFGNAVAATTTLNHSYGSGIVVEGAGFLLNNEMDDFSCAPGMPNSFGLLGGEANSIVSGKRMLSSMTPTIVLKDGKIFMVTGSPGGSRIITSVLQSILNVIDFGMTMQKAVDMPRFHHQWYPDKIYYEENAIDSVTNLKLHNAGYITELSGLFGRVDAILILEGGLMESGADPRGDDSACGK